MHMGLRGGVCRRVGTQSFWVHPREGPANYCYPCVCVGPDDHGDRLGPRDCSLVGRHNEDLSRLLKPPGCYDYLGYRYSTFWCETLPRISVVGRTDEGE